MANCTYIDKRENLFLLGPVGVGKTHVAQALAHIACRMGHEAFFTKAAKMFRYLNGGRADNSLRKGLSGILPHNFLSSMILDLNL